MSILNNAVLGTNDLDSARAFYDAVLATLGGRRLMDLPGRSLWGEEGPEFTITLPIDGGAASPANGGTIGFRAPSDAAVDAFHAVALAHGAKNEGAPGPRAVAPGLYVAFLRDLDGNKIGAVHFTWPDRANHQ